jgi:hypothetical protein
MVWQGWFDSAVVPNVPAAAILGKNIILDRPFHYFRIGCIAVAIPAPGVQCAQTVRSNSALK